MREFRRAGSLFAAIAISGFCIPHAALATSDVEESSGWRSSVEPQFECDAIFLLLEGPTSARKGESARYRFQVFNEGDCDLDNAVVSDFIPRDTTFVSAAPAPTSKSPRPPAPGEEPREPVAKLEWSRVPLKKRSASPVYEVVVKVRGATGRVMTNTACIEHPRAGRICDEFDTFVRSTR